MHQIHILIIDDEPEMHDLLREGLSDYGYKFTGVFDGIGALDRIAKQHFDVVLLDVKLPGISGMEVLREIWRRDMNTEVIMISAIDEVDTAVEAMRLGAVDYIQKPFDIGRLCKSIAYALRNVSGMSLSAISPTIMDAIELGVEQRQDLIDGHSALVTRSTIRVARRIGVSDKEIASWAANRLRSESERKNSLGAAIGKIQANPLAQAVLGISQRYTCSQALKDLRN